MRSSAMVGRKGEFWVSWVLSGCIEKTGSISHPQVAGDEEGRSEQVPRAENGTVDGLAPFSWVWSTRGAHTGAPFDMWTLF